MITTYFHGGFGGLSPGQFVVPPNVSKASSTASYGAAGVCNRDKVYVTTEFHAALLFACAHPSGKGKVYEVEPVGEVEDDPDAQLPGFSFQCERARVKRVIKVKGKMIRQVQKELLAQLRSGAAA